MAEGGVIRGVKGDTFGSRLLKSRLKWTEKSNMAKK